MSDDESIVQQIVQSLIENIENCEESERQSKNVQNNKDKLKRRHKKRQISDEEDDDPTFIPEHFSTRKSAKKAKKENVRRSTRLHKNDTNSNDSSDFIESKVSKKKSIKSDPTSSNTSPNKFLDDIKRKHLKTSLEFGLNISHLKQRLNAKDSLITNLNNQFEVIERLKKKINLERAQIKIDKASLEQEREMSQKQNSDTYLLNTQLQNENTRLRKINVYLQNAIVSSEKKLNEKEEILSKIGLDTDESFQRFNPYSNVIKLDAKKERQRLLFNCADTIAAGTIEDGIQLVSDLLKDLQEDISVKYVGRGNPVLAETNQAIGKAEKRRRMW